ncbi:MAG: circadian clock KaiB family protein, partial [Vicinamibacteria bacterium]
VVARPHPHGRAARRGRPGSGSKIGTSMSRRGTFRFMLYVAGDAPNSAQAISNLGDFCRGNLVGRYEIETVDVFQEPKRALSEGIFMTPTLVVLSPPPARRIVGTLSHTPTLMLALGLVTVVP